MTEFLETLFGSLFADNVILATILISMIPVIELRVGIPFGMAKEIWGAAALSYSESFLWAFIGSSAIVLILAPIIKPIINWLKKTKLFRKLAIWFEKRILGKTEKIEEDSKKETTTKKSQWKKILGVFMFVAIPMPLTGVWTGTCIAVFLGLKFWQTCLTVIGGNLCAGLIMMLISAIFKEHAMTVVYVFFIIFLILLLISLIKVIVSNKKKSKLNISQEENKTLDEEKPTEETK